MSEVSDATIITDPVSEIPCPTCGEILDVTGLESFSLMQCPKCATEFNIPAKFGNFMLLRLLGAGGMGGVYRGLDTGLNREVAIKVMLRSLGENPTFVANFQREAQAAARLNHPNIAQIYSFGQEKNQPYIAMELVSGGSLDRMIEKEPEGLDPAFVMKVGAQIAAGLNLAAESGLVHGDVKPENILFDNDENAKLVDFGLAALMGDTSEIWGTPYYISPEKVRRAKVDFRSDIYSLGGTLYHALTGLPPFEGEDATAVVKARFTTQPKPMSEIRPSIPQELDAIIARMLALEPSRRYPTYESLLSDINRFLGTVKPARRKLANKKIVIKGKSGGGAPVTPLVADPDASTQAALLNEEPSKGIGLMVGLVAGGVLLGLLLLAGGLYAYVSYANEQDAKALATKIATNQDVLRTANAKTMSASEKLIADLNELADKSLAEVKKTANELKKLLGAEATAGMIPPEPDYDAVARAKVGGAKGASDKKDKNAVKVTIDTMQIPVDPATGKVPVLSDEQRQETVEQLVSFGVSESDARKWMEIGDKYIIGKTEAEARAAVKALSATDRELFERVLNKLNDVLAETMSDAVASMGGAMMKDIAGQVGATISEMGKASIQEDLNSSDGDGTTALAAIAPAVAQVQKLFLDAYEIRQAVATLRVEREKLAAIAARAESLTAVDAATLTKLEAVNMELGAAFEALRGAPYVTSAQRKAGIIRKSCESLIKTTLADLAIAQKRAERERLAQEKKDAEEAKRTAAAEAKAAAEAAEVARAKEEYERQNSARLRFAQWDMALRQMQHLESSFKTPAGKAAFATYKERVQLMSDLQKHFVTHAKGFKFADNKTIVTAVTSETIQLDNQVPMEWEKFYRTRPNGFNELIGRLVQYGLDTYRMTRIQWANNMMGAALILQTLYPELPSAQKRAEGLVTTAVKEFSACRPRAERFFPDMTLDVAAGE